MRTFLLVSLLALTACGGGKTFVDTPTTSPQRFTSVAIRPMADTTAVPQPVKDLFVRELEKQLYTEKKFQKGVGLIVNYSFVQFEEGDRLKRYVAGFSSWGASSVNVRATFQDSTGAVLGVITSEGTISGGLFGGSQDEAVENAAEQIANYAEKNFKATQ